jgi:hypothetical protein
MYNLHYGLVLLVDAMLIFILHVFVQDLVKGGRLNGIEKLLEMELLLGESWGWSRSRSRSRSGVVAGSMVRRCRDDRDGDEGEQEEAEEEALEPGHLG